MMKKLWPGPVGLRFEVPEAAHKAAAKKLGFDERDVYDEQGRITLRLPDHPVAREVIAAVKGPVVLTASRAAHRVEELEEALEKVDLVLDAGPTRYSKPSTLVDVSGEKYEIVRAGVYDERIIERMLRTTILFICSGNTCRSPMSEALARKVIAKKLNVGEEDLEKKGISVLSAGAFAMPGSRATPQAVEAVRALGADLSKHRSRLLTVELIHQADHIFTMSRAHLEAVLALVPSARDKVTTLKPDGDIEDPIGLDVSVYQQLAGELEKLIEARLKEGALL
jgi:protein-tyrosine phosphatase